MGLCCSFAPWQTAVTSLHTDRRCPKCNMAPPLITLIDPDSLCRSHFAQLRTYRRAISALAMSIAPQWRWCLSAPIVLEIGRIETGRGLGVFPCPPPPPRVPQPPGKLRSGMRMHVHIRSALACACAIAMALAVISNRAPHGHRRVPAAGDEDLGSFVMGVYLNADGGWVLVLRCTNTHMSASLSHGACLMWMFMMPTTAMLLEHQLKLCHSAADSFFAS